MDSAKSIQREMTVSFRISAAICVRTCLALVVLLGFVGVQTRVWGQEPDIIIITPKKGVGNKYELVRVHEDKVELRKEGFRLTYERANVEKVRVPSAEGVVEAVVADLSEVEEERLDDFPDLIKRLEVQLPKVKALADRYGWLIPDASPTYLKTAQSIADIQNTMSVVKNLDTVRNEVERMASGVLPLSATWEETIGTALEDTKQIPYMQVRRKVVQRFQSLRRKIRLDLARSVDDIQERVRSIGEDLLSEARTGELTGVGLTLHVKEMRRAATRIPDPEIKAEINLYIAETEEGAKEHLRRFQKLQQALAVIEKVRKLESDLDQSIQDPFPEADLEKRRTDLEEAVAALPADVTNEELLRSLEQLKVRIAAKAATASRREVDGPDTVTSATETAVEKKPAATARTRRGKPFWMDWRVWVIVAFAIGLMLMLLLRGAFRSTEVMPPTEIRQMPQPDVVQGGSGPPRLPPAVSALAATTATANPGAAEVDVPEEEDIFGFGEETPKNSSETETGAEQVSAPGGDEITSIESAEEEESDVIVGGLPSAEAVEATPAVSPESFLEDPFAGGEAPKPENLLDFGEPDISPTAEEPAPEEPASAAFNPADFLAPPPTDMPIETPPEEEIVAVPEPVVEPEPAPVVEVVAIEPVTNSVEEPREAEAVQDEPVIESPETAEGADDPFGLFGEGDEPPEPLVVDTDKASEPEGEGQTDSSTEDDPFGFDASQSGEEK